MGEGDGEQTGALLQRADNLLDQLFGSLAVSLPSWAYWMFSPSLWLGSVVQLGDKQSEGMLCVAPHPPAVLTGS